VISAAICRTDGVGWAKKPISVIINAFLRLTAVITTELFSGQAK
jgi:hypothetical protein